MLATLFKKGLLIASVLLCCQSLSYSQTSNGKKVNLQTSGAPSTSTSNQLVTLVNPVCSALGYHACNAKSLYEQAFNITLSEEEFRTKCKSSLLNKQDWIIVKAYFQNNSDVDLTAIESMIAAFDAKL